MSSTESSQPGDLPSSLVILRSRFRAATPEFATSPLYQRLCPAVAEDDFLLGLVERRQPGQDPPFLLFGAVHYLLLSGAHHDLGRYYPSIQPQPRRAGPSVVAAFKDFCVEHEADLRSLIGVKLVQTNVVNRATALLYALWAIGQQTRDAVHLIDVGTSAGAHLAFDRYRYEVGGHVFGDPASPVRLTSQWRSARSVPRLDERPAILSRIGIDLNPFDASDPDQRLWLRALVWPEDTDKATTLSAALAMVANDPPRTLRGDATAIVPTLSDTYPSGDTVVVFHAAVRMHLRADSAAAFDRALDSLAHRGPLFHVSLEPATATHHALTESPPGGLQMHGPSNPTPIQLAETDGHLLWIKPR